jgi:hypothetical protein
MLLYTCAHASTELVFAVRAELVEAWFVRHHGFDELSPNG